MIRFKFAANFQTVEMDFENYEDACDQLEEIVDTITLLNELSRKVEVNGPLNAPKPAQKEDELATDKQIATLKKLGIEPHLTMTKKEAWKILSEKLGENK